MICLKRYQVIEAKAWNDFLSISKNATLLFHRGFMDYHADRFSDHSLMFYEEEKLVALLPGNVRDGIFYSHQGLTYGGFLTNNNMRTPLMLALFDELIAYLKSNEIKKIIYKPIPQFYSSVPAQEDLYALFRQGFTLFRRDVSSVINLQETIQFSELRRRMVKKAISSGLTVSSSTDLESFYTILQNNLRSKHETNAVHSLDEVKLLSERFPEKVKLYASFKDGVMLAATWVFINKSNVHLQYIASSEEGRKIGALDLVISHLITQEFSTKNYFDFGISTEQGGLYLNEGLISQKEMFGARAYCYDQYELDLSK